MKGILWGKWIVGIAIFGVVLWGMIYVWDAIDRMVLDVAEPVIRTVGDVSNRLADIVLVLRQSPQRAEDIRTLRIQNGILTARLALMEHIERENKELRLMLGRETEQIQFILARVGGRSPSLLDDYLTLDAGIVDGVEVGMPVLVNEAIHIGIIAKAAERSAVVRLFSHAGEKGAVYIPEAGVSSVAVGKGAGLFEIQVPESITVREGESILSVGPPDFIVGYVEKVERSDAGPFHIVRSSHPVLLEDVRTVYILKK